MARVVIVFLVVASLAFVLACGGGSSPTVPGGDQSDVGKTGTQGDPVTGDTPDDGSDLEIVFVSATPQVGPTPLKVDFLAVIRGGIPPYNFYWDFTDDSAPDIIANEQTVTTATSSFTYPFLEEDLFRGLTQSTFSARFWVTDSRIDENTLEPNPATRISGPVTVVVTSGSSFKFNAAKTGVTNAEYGSESVLWKVSPTDQNEKLKDPGFYTFKSGDDIRFLAEAADGAPPYKYRWNFDYAILVPSSVADPETQQTIYYPVERDYRIDSTVESPHYSYSYNNRPDMTEEANYRIVLLEAIDSLGNSVNQFIGIKVVPVDFTPPPPPDTFKVFVTTDPPVSLDDDPAPFSAKDVPILVQFDKNNLDATGRPIVPQIFLSASVSTSPDESGTPPYSFAWDFEGDGYIDSQVVSPTIPYWDSASNSLYNPYNWPGDYVCKLRVRDSVGIEMRIDIPVRSVDITGQKPYNMLTLKPFARQLIEETGLVEGEFFTSGANIVFTAEVSGGVPPYKLFWDRDFDGVFTTRPIEPNAGWDDPPGSYEDDFAVEITDTMSYPEKIIAAEFDAGALVAGYYIGAVRALDSSIPPVQISKSAPVSIVDVPAQLGTVESILQPRAYHGVTAIGGDVYVVGGFLGNVALQSVDRVRWGDMSYSVDSSQRPGSALTDMPTARGALGIGSLENHLIVTGGIANLDGTTGVNETMLLGNSGVWEWINRPSIGYRSGVNLELSHHGMAACTMAINFGGGIGVADADGFLVAGGRLEGGSVSPTVWFYLPHEGWPDYDPASFSPSQYDFWFLLPELPTPRYDFATVALGNWVYVIGGVTADGTLSNAVEAINMQNPVWISMPALTKPASAGSDATEPAPRAGAAAISYGPEEFIAVFGGYSAIDSNGDYVLAEDSLIYSPRSGMWTKTYPIDEPRAHVAGTVISNAMFIVGGENAVQSEQSKFFELRLAPDS
ncbi:hypothetical protein J7K50_02605 [bacterium]|nr:hypothetical protein [bacterium]